MQRAVGESDGKRDGSCEARSTLMERFRERLRHWSEGLRARGADDQSEPAVNGSHGPSEAGEPRLASGTTLKILIFDAQLEDLARGAGPFERRGFEVHRSASIEGSMRLIEREQFDFALVDQGSVAFEGLRVIRHMMRYNPETPFVVVTQQKDAQCGRRALAAGADDYLEKPVAEAEIEWLIAQLVRKAGAR
jgi:CheY-like chemotaxis protein